MLMTGIVTHMNSCVRELLTCPVQFYVKGMNKNLIKSIPFDGGMSYVRICKSHVLKIVDRKEG